MFESTNHTAIIPAAGKGSRMGRLPHSKELLPIGQEKDKNHLQPVASFLFERLRDAGVNNIHLILRKGKTDLIDRFRSGKEWGVSLAYHITESDRGVPFTIAQALPHINGKSVLFGFPDILFYPSGAFRQLRTALEAQKETDVLLGLFPVKEAFRWDTVILTDRHQVTDVRIKEPSDDPNRYAWIIAAWKPVFSDFIHRKINEWKETSEPPSNEIAMGDVIRLAIGEGLVVKGLRFEQGGCLDIGTPEGYGLAENFLQRIE